MAKATTIVIEVRDSDGNVIAKKESLLWSTAIENLYKLQRYVEKNEIPSELGKHII